MFSAYALTFCRIAIAIMFALAWMGKIRNITTFQEAISDFRLLPENWSKVVARISISLELVTIVFMIIGKNLLLVGFLLAIGLLTTFSIALVTTLLRKMKVICNCFGLTENPISPYDIVRNLLFILCSAVGIWTFFIPLQNISISEVILTGFISLHYVILVVNIGDVVETLRRPFHLFGTS